MPFKCMVDIKKLRGNIKKNKIHKMEKKKLLKKAFTNSSRGMTVKFIERIIFYTIMSVLGMWLYFLSLPENEKIPMLVFVLLGIGVGVLLGMLAALRPGTSVVLIHLKPTCEEVQEYGNVLEEKIEENEKEIERLGVENTKLNYELSWVKVF